mmetsp:Transcript_43453/g.41916  ORF Transcript_43453/g.41916 Transcript_43453/m.41916 type:complete len:227 (-) Transcript_43453:2526-3206(-)
MILRAIKTSQIDFLYAMFAFNKNYEEIPMYSIQKPIINMSEGNGTESEAGQFRVYTFEYIFKKIVEFTEENSNKFIKQIANWKLKSSENILKALLTSNQDKVACEVALFYIDNADINLLKFAITNYNEVFLKYSFRNQIFGSNLLNQEDILDMILGIFEGGAKTELILNLLIFSDLSRWEQARIRWFVNMIKDIIKSAHEKNRILLCYNPILAICLSCEYLNKIGN